MSREERTPAYNDSDLMNFGKYKDETLADVPASYLLWLWEQGKHRDTKLDNYMWNSLPYLLDEHPDHILTRKI